MNTETDTKTNPEAEQAENGTTTPHAKTERDLTPRQMDDGPFAWVSQAALIRARYAEGEHGMAVLLALAARAPINGSDFKASVQNISEGASLSRSKTFKVLNSLRQARVLAWDSGRGNGGDRGNVANTYRLLRVTLSFAEGGDPRLVHNADNLVRNEDNLVRRKRARKGQDRDISAERQRDVSAPAEQAAAAGAAASPDRGAESGSEQVKQRDPNEW